MLRRSRPHSQKRGEEFEKVLYTLLHRLLKELGFQITKARRQMAWFFECKNYNSPPDTSQVLGKLAQARRSTHQPDAWVLVSPFYDVSNELDELLEEEGKRCSFEIIAWTPERGIRELFSVYPDLYKQVYDEVIRLAERERKRRLAGWNQRLSRPPAQKRAVRDFCSRLIAANEYLDFRGILQMREILRLRVEDLYVPLWAMLEAARQPFPREAGRIQRVPTSVHPPSRGGGNIIEGDQALVKELVQWGRMPDRRVGVAQALREHPRLVILGDPGTGKSTLLRLIALTFARGDHFVAKRFQLQEDRLPLLIPIAAYGEAITQSRKLDFADFLFQRLAAEGLRDTTIVQRALERGECLVLLDGLDEVLDLNTRIQVSREIERFVRNSDQRNRVVVTSRVAGYQRVGLTGDFSHVTLLPFGDAEIKAFVQNWARAYESYPKPTAGWEQRAEKRAQDLIESISSTPAIQRLAANPLLATILALIHQQGRRLPFQRVELYRLCVEALAEHWQRARSLYRPIDLFFGARRLDETYVVGKLAPIAFWAFETRATGLVHRAELEKKLEEEFVIQEDANETEARSLAHDFVELIREQSGLLIERGPELFDFLHPTFREYLAARYIGERREPLQVLDKYLLLPWWREIVLLTAGILKGDHLEDFLGGILRSGTKYDHLLHRELLLAARCLADNVTASATLVRTILDRLFTLWRKTQLPSLRQTIGELFVEAKGSQIAREIATRLLSLLSTKDGFMLKTINVAIGDNFKIVYPLRAKRHVMHWCVAEALSQLGEREKVAQALQGFAGDKKPLRWERRVTAFALGQLGEGEKAIEAMRDLAQDRSLHAWERGTAAEILGQLGERGKAVEVLLSLAQDKRADRWIPVCVVGALRRLGDRSERVLSKLLALAKDEDVIVEARRRAAEALGQLGERGKAVEALLDLAQDRKKVDAWTRQRAAHALGQLGERAKAAELLLALVQDKRVRPETRSKAARALGELGERERVTRPLLSIAQDEGADAQVRRSTALALGQLGEREKAARLLLTLVHAEGVEAWVRRTAALALGQLGEREKAARLLLTLVRSKKPSAVHRASAVKALGELGLVNKRVLEALAQWTRARGEPSGVRDEASAALDKLLNVAVDESITSKPLVSGVR
jgi:HEAT repeat protein